MIPVTSTHKTNDTTKDKCCAIQDTITYVFMKDTYPHNSILLSHFYFSSVLHLTKQLNTSIDITLAKPKLIKQPNTSININLTKPDLVKQPVDLVTDGFVADDIVVESLSRSFCR